jgi:predicted RecA/RadA family phage recombinase
VLRLRQEHGVATVGTILYWDDTNNVVTTTATGNKQIGKSVRCAASADTTVRVRLSQ